MSYYQHNLISTLLNHGFIICSFHRALHDKSSKLKQIFRSKKYPRNFVDWCIKTILDIEFTKCQYICTVPKKELICVFPVLKKKLLEIKKCLLNSIEGKSPYCTLKILFKSSAKIVNQFRFKEMLPQKKFYHGIIYTFK